MATVAVAGLVAVAAMADDGFPGTLQGCWTGEIAGAPAVLEWTPSVTPSGSPSGAWRGMATVGRSESAPVVERHTLSPPRAGVVNLGWRYCHPERERRKGAERCYWTQGPKGDLEEFVTFDAADDQLLIEWRNGDEVRTLFSGARSTCAPAG